MKISTYINPFARPMRPLILLLALIIAGLFGCGGEKKGEEGAAREAVARVVERWVSGETAVTLDDGGTLRVSGVGVKMEDYSAYSKLPWKCYKDPVPVWLREILPEPAHYRIDSIAAVIVEEGVTHIGRRAFLRCNYLTSATIPGSVTHIGAYAFNDCGNLTSVTIEDGVTSIGEGAFAYTGITSITIPNSVTSIKANAFAGAGLTSITIPQNVTVIEDGMFTNCKNLTSVTIPDHITRIGKWAFAKAGLTSVMIPSSITSIDKQAFEGCDSLTSVTIEDGVESIGWSAFAYTGITSITIPNSVMDIKENAFAGTGLTSVTFPKHVTTIEDSVLINCKSLTSVTIQEHVTRIGKRAFDGCDSLTSITILNPVPPDIGYEAFDGLPPNVCLHVPQNSVAAYRAVDRWEVFKCIKPLPSDDPPLPELCAGIATVKSNYNNMLLLLAISLIWKDEIGNLFTGMDSLYYENPWYSSDVRKKIITREPRVVDSLLCMLKQTKGRRVVLNRIRHWFDVLNMIYAMNKKVDEEADICCEDYNGLLFEIPITRPLWATIIDTTMQDAYSLSSSQIFMIDYQISTYVSGLSDKDRATFYRTLTRLVNRRIAESSKK